MEISYGVGWDLALVSKKMDAYKYIELLIPGAHALHGDNCILLQENTPCHGARVTRVPGGKSSQHNILPIKYS